MLPLRHRKKRSQRKKYELAVGVFLFILFLWMAGFRLHLDDFDNLFSLNGDRNVWKMELKSGDSYFGRVIHKSSDAVTVESSKGRIMALSHEIAVLEKVSMSELPKLAAGGLILSREKKPLVTWAKQDMIFHGLFASSRINSGSSDNSLTGKMMTGALKNLPKEGVGGISKDKIMKAYREGKLDQKKIQEKIKTMDPKVVEEYRKKAVSGGF